MKDARLKKKMREARRQVFRAAGAVDVAEKVQRRAQEQVDFFRNVWVAAAFSRGMGVEVPLTEAVGTLHPELLK